jgi:hypothetical protein
VRIFFSGDEEVGRRHLPIAQAKVNEFVARTRSAGLSQDTFSFIFEESGARIFAQYAFGQVSMQIHAPFIPLAEEEPEEPEESFAGPKTFYVNTTQGYFWVEVRYVDGVAMVVLTPFSAAQGDDFVYPGIGLVSPGMISGTVDGTDTGRYVLAQSGGVADGSGDKTGSVLSTKIAPIGSRISVIKNTGESHQFVIIKNTGQEAEVYRINILLVDTRPTVTREYADIRPDAWEEAILPVSILHKGPCWIHRKCFGSYFSPNKTIGYHVDIGADSARIGNMTENAGVDLLDNTGGYTEALFNHAPDLYRIISLASFPLEHTESSTTVAVVSPTMLFTSSDGAERCWGGHGADQSNTGCADYSNDQNYWVLAPRILLCEVKFSTGEKVFTDPMNNVDSYFFSSQAYSWDGTFSAALSMDASYDCGSLYHNLLEKKQASGQCTWIDVCSWVCDINDPGSNGDCPKGWTPFFQWQYFFRENIRSSKHVYFTLGGQSPAPLGPMAMNGFYFMFDGLWHLDVGVLWASSQTVGNSCGLCVYPRDSQEPGKNVTFVIQGVDKDWVLDNGREYVVNMEVVTPLSYVPWSGGSAVGFVAKVPDEYVAPHEPVLMIGGIEYQSRTVPGETVSCERGIMSAPCLCEDNEMVFSPEFVFELNTILEVAVLHGCPPFYYVGQNVTFNGKSHLLTDSRVVQADAENCFAQIDVIDACGTRLTVSDTYEWGSATVTDVKWLSRGETAAYYHTLGPGAEYTGELIKVSDISGSGIYGAILMMPNAAPANQSHIVSWSGVCGSYVSTVTKTRPWCAEAPSSGYIFGDFSVVVGLYVKVPPHPAWPSGYCGYVTNFVSMIASSGQCSEYDEGRWWIVDAGGGSHYLQHRMSSNWEGPIKCYTTAWVITYEWMM